MYNDNETKYNYKGIDIHCPQCGRMHGLGIIRSCLNSDREGDEALMKCPTCGLIFDGVTVANWRRSEAFKELNEALEGLCDAFTEQASTTENKIVWTVYFLDENNHEVKKCFRTKCNEHSISYILEHLNNTCRDGERYRAWETLD